MTITFLFLLLLLLENLLLPALLGPKSFLIVPLFVFSLIIYDKNIKPRLTQAVIFLLIAEFFSVSGFGSMVLPFVIVIGLYLWSNRFLSISSNLREGGFWSSLFGGITFLTLLIFVYSYIFLFFQLSNNVSEAWISVMVFIKTSFYQILGWALVLVIIFKHVFKKK